MRKAKTCNSSYKTQINYQKTLPVKASQSTMAQTIGLKIQDAIVGIYLIHETRHKTQIGKDKDWKPHIY
jgi:hypothetical protein